MKCLVINLDRATERLLRMRATFAAQDLAFERLPAVDGQTLSPDEIDRWRQGAPRFYPLRTGEVACFLSHRSAWAIAARDNAPVAVFEDDVHLGGNAREVLTSASWIPGDSNVVKLETCGLPVEIERSPAFTVGDRAVVRLHGGQGAAGAGGYIVTPSGAETLLATSETFCDPVDQFMFRHATLIMHQLVPAICVQDVFVNPDSPESELRKERRAHRLTGSAKLRREARRPFERLALALKGTAINACGPHEWRAIPFE